MGKKRKHRQGPRAVAAQAAVEAEREAVSQPVVECSVIEQVIIEGEFCSEGDEPSFVWHKDVICHDRTRGVRPQISPELVRALDPSPAVEEDPLETSAHIRALETDRANLREARTPFARRKLLTPITRFFRALSLELAHAIDGCLIGMKVEDRGTSAWHERFCAYWQLICFHARDRLRDRLMHEIDDSVICPQHGSWVQQREVTQPVLADMAELTNDRLRAVLLYVFASPRLHHQSWAFVFESPQRHPVEGSKNLVPDAVYLRPEAFSILRDLRLKDADGRAARAAFLQDVGWVEPQVQPEVQPQVAQSQGWVQLVLNFRARPKVPPQLTAQPRVQARPPAVQTPIQAPVSKQPQPKDRPRVQSGMWNPVINLDRFEALSALLAGTDPPPRAA